jgi:hypothetical protein
VDRDGTSSILIYGAQFEAGSIPTSWVPTLGAQATRAADTATILAADMPWNAAGMSFQMSGLVTYAYEGTSNVATFFSQTADSDNNIVVRLDTDAGTGDAVFIQEAGGVQDFVQSVSAFTQGANVPFNIASYHTPASINGALSGTALTANTTPVTLADLSATDFRIGTTFNGFINQLVVWPNDIEDAGIEEATS